MLKRLRRIDKRYEIVIERGKGSHRMVALPVGNGEMHYPFPCHDDGTDIKPCYLRDIIKYFGLPKDIFD